MRFRQQVEKGTVDLGLLRQGFDIFFSRVSTIRKATVFESLRASPTSAAYLERLVAFLDSAVPIIDSAEDVLIE